MVTAKPARVVQPAIAPERDDAAAAFISGNSRPTASVTSPMPATVAIPSTPINLPAPTPQIAAMPVDDHRLTLRMPQEMKDELDRLRATRYRGMTLTGVILLALNGFIDQNKSN
jgi:hypothetical protein